MNNYVQSNIAELEEFWRNLHAAIRDYFVLVGINPDLAERQVSIFIEDGKKYYAEISAKGVEEPDSIFALRPFLMGRIREWCGATEPRREDCRDGESG